MSQAFQVFVNVLAKDEIFTNSRFDLEPEKGILFKLILIKKKTFYRIIALIVSIGHIAAGKFIASSNRFGQIVDLVFESWLRQCADQKRTERCADDQAVHEEENHQHSDRGPRWFERNRFSNNRRNAQHKRPNIIFEFIFGANEMFDDKCDGDCRRQNCCPRVHGVNLKNIAPKIAWPGRGHTYRLACKSAKSKAFL